MSENEKESDKNIFDESTTEIVDLNSSQEENDEVQVVNQEIEVVEEEAIHRLRPIPSPPIRNVRNSRMNPVINLDRNDIPYVRLDRREIANYLEQNKEKEISPQKYST